VAGFVRIFNLSPLGALRSGEVSWLERMAMKKEKPKKRYGKKKKRKQS